MDDNQERKEAAASSSVLQWGGNGQTNEWDNVANCCKRNIKEMLL